MGATWCCGEVRGAVYVSIVLVAEERSLGRMQVNLIWGDGETISRDMSKLEANLIPHLKFMNKL